MDSHQDKARHLCLGTAYGLLGGLIGAAAVNAFQELIARVGITSGVKGMPSTERAAERLARLTGRRLSRRDRPVAGEAVHYAMGALVGGVYGAAAELDPRVTCGGGTAFGMVSAAVVDETLVPAFRFGDPISRAPWQSHPYSCVSHLVYGAFTESARKMFRSFFGRVRKGARVVCEARAQAIPAAMGKLPDNRRWPFSSARPPAPAPAHRWPSRAGPRIAAGSTCRTRRCPSSHRRKPSPSRR